MSLPKTVQNLTGTAVSNTSINVYWSAITDEPDLDKYKIFFTVNGYTFNSLADKSQTSMNMGSLVKNTTYKIQGLGIQYNTNTVPSDSESPPIYVKTLNIPEAPTNLVVSNITDSSFTLSWTASSGATSYQVYVNGVAYGSPVTGTSTSVTGLSPSTHYYVTVSAINNDGESDYASVSEVTTAAIPIPSAPTGLNSSNITTTSFTLSWDAVTSATSYQVYKDGTAYGAPTSNTSLSITGLTSNSNNTMVVTAINSSGESTQSSSLDVLTLPEAPSNLASSNITQISFTLVWTAPTNHTGLTYQVYKDGSPYGSPITGTSINVTSLTGNTSYNMTVSAINSSGESTQSSSLDVLTLPEAPSNLVSSNITQTSFTLSWNSVTGLTYQVYKNGVAYGSPITGTSINVTGLTANSTYNMTVTAINSSGESAQSTALSVQTAAIPIPAIPIGLGSSNITKTSFTLSWTASSGATSYQVYKNGTAYGSPATSTSLSITGLTSNTTFNMTVTAINSSGESSQSSPLDVLTLPEAPTNLVESNVTATSFDLSWTASAGTGLTYQVYKDGTAYGSSITDTSINVTGLTANTTFSMTVTAINSSGESVQSSSLDVLTLTEAPVNLVSNNITQTSFTLNWDAVTGATSYQVYKDGTAYGSPTTDTSLSITGLTANTSYTMTVTAINGSGESAQSASLNSVTAPEAPTNLVESNVTATSFDLSWTASSGATSYQVYKDGSSYGSPVTSTSLSITGLTPNTTSTMTVSAINGSGESSQSSPLDVLTLTEAPTNLISSNITQTSFTLNWDAVTGATSYQVYKDGTAYGSPITDTSLSITGLTGNTTSSMTVSVNNSSGESTQSSPLNVLTLPEAPSNLVSSAQTANTITIDWDTPVGGADSYKVYVDGVEQTGITITTV